MTKRRSPVARGRITPDGRAGRRLEGEGSFHEHITKAKRDRGGRTIGHEDVVVKWNATQRPPTTVRTERRAAAKRARASRKRNRGR